MPKKKTEAQVTSPKPKLPAINVVSQFLKENNIMLTLTNMEVRNVDDGSMIIDKPIIRAKYINE